MTGIRVAVVGAGMAGLACARALRAAGAEVVVFDKGRSPGGRVSTRRRDGLIFNHGAQYATARTPAFQAVLAGLHAEGAAAVWDAAGGRDPRWTGVPGMSALPRALAAGLDVRTDRHVLFLHRDPAGWTVRHEAAGQVRPGTVADAGGVIEGPFAAVALALPSSQAAPLLRAMGHAFAGPVADVVVDPCWSVMFTTAARLDRPDFAQNVGELATVSRDSARPGRAPGPESWVLQASPGWSRAHEEDAAGDVAAALLAMLPDAPGTVDNLHAHRWRYSRTRTPLGQPFLWDGAPGAALPGSALVGTALGVCGDWCTGARVEDAFTSGAALADAIAR